jgi:O-antigen/teichoic acid export membrane protein
MTEQADAGPASTPAAGESIGARGATGVGIASLVAAVSGIVVLFIAAHTLTKAQNAEFLSFWGLIFFLFGTFGGLQNEATRTVHVALHRPSSSGPARGPRVVPAGLALGAAVAAVLLATARLWAPGTLGTRWVPLTAVVVAGVVAFAGHSAVAGALAGSGRWSTYSRLVGAEATVRLLLVAAVAVAGARTVGLEAASAGAAGTWLILAVVLRPLRQAFAVRADDTHRLFASRTAQAMLATAASSAFVVGFPVLLRITTPADAFAAAAPLILAVQLTRAPLLMPLVAYQGVAITYFLAHRDQGARALLRLGAVILAVGIAGGGLAALIGPWLLSVFGGPGYDAAPLMLATLTFAASLLALLTLTGIAVLSVGAHRAYALGWLAATAVGIGILLLPATIDARVAASLLTGPVVGVAIHVAAISRATRRGR